MFSRLRRRMTYANVVATLALLFAMSGGALAAGHYLITSTKQINPKVLKQLQGARGPAGLAGSAGVAGVAGTKGENGDPGSNGSNGSNGVSPIGVAFTGAAHGCTAGGVEYKGATTNFVCNGKAGTEGPGGPEGGTGPEGPEGKPWTMGGRLPSGKTVYGHWAASGMAEGASGLALGINGVATTGVSFPLPLQKPPSVTFIKEGEATPEPKCSGTAEAPGPPEPGSLCIFVQEESNILYGDPLSGNQPLQSADERGFTISAYSAGKGPMYLFGQWALTAE